MAVTIPFDVNDYEFRDNFFRETVPGLLDELEDETEPGWGEMTAQQMVEHLSRTFLLSTGAFDVECVTPEEKRGKLRAFLHTDRPMPKGFRNPTLSGDQPELRYENLDEAKEKLKDIIRYYRRYFAENPEHAHTHPVFGTLDAEAWDKFHFKHCFHHLSQFGLIERE